jgi:alkylation response protein AidB-like acyl-CoA dehydrogenase
MEWERSCLFATHLGAMEKDLKDCIEHAKNRHQFGQSIVQASTARGEGRDSAVG